MRPNDKITPARLGLLLLAMAIAGVGQWFIFHQLYWTPATIALVLGCLLGAVLLGPPDEMTILVVPAPPRRTALTVLGILIALGGVAVIAYASYRLFYHWSLEFDWMAPLLMAGVALTSLGLALLDRPWRTAATSTPWTWWEAVALAAVVLLAFFMRFHRYDYFPPWDGFYAIEEPQSGMGAWDIVARHARPWEFLIDRWLGVPGFIKYGTDSITVLRIPFSVVSALTIPAMYLLARQMVSPPAALFGATLLAMSRWHLNYARNAHNIFPTTLLVVVVLALCVRAYKRGGLRLYPWIGFWSGYTLYAYAGYRGTPVLVAVFLLVGAVHAFLAWRRALPSTRGAERTKLAVRIAGGVIAGIFMLVPVGILVGQLRDNPAYFLEAANRSYQNKTYYTDDWGSWVRLRLMRQVEIAQIFHHRGDSEQAYNLPNEPMLDPVTGVLFTLALFYCVWFWRHRLQGYFAWAFLFLLLVGGTITQTLVVCRLQGIVPILFVLIAFTADRVWDIARPRRGWKPVLGMMAAAVLGTALYLNYQAYFDRTMNSPIVRAVFRNFYTSGIAYYHTIPSSGYLLFVSDMHNFFDSNDYAWWRGDRVPGSVSVDLWPLLHGDSSRWKDRELHVLIQQPFEKEELMNLIRDFYPGADCKLLRHPEPLPHLDQMACVIRDSKPVTQLNGGIHASYFRNAETTPFLERDEPIVSWAMVPDQCETWGNHDTFHCRAEWAGVIDFPADGEYEIDVESRDSQVDVNLDDQPLPRPNQIRGGRHTLKIRAAYQNTVNIGVRVRWKKAGDPSWKLYRFDHVAAETGNAG